MESSSAEHQVAVLAFEAGLTSRETQCLVLSAAQGLSLREISTQLSISVSCVRTHLWRGGKRIREKIEEDARRQELRETVAQLRERCDAATPLREHSIPLRDWREPDRPLRPPGPLQPGG